MAKKETKRIQLWAGEAESEVFFNNFKVWETSDHKIRVEIHVLNDHPEGATATTNQRWMLCERGTTPREIMGQYTYPQTEGDKGVFLGEFNGLNSGTIYTIYAWLLNADNEVVYSEEYDVATKSAIPGSSVCSSSTYKPQQVRIGERGGVPVIVNTGEAESLGATFDNNREEYRDAAKTDIYLSASRDAIIEMDAEDPSKWHLLRWTRRGYDRGKLVLSCNALAAANAGGGTGDLDTKDFVNVLYDGCCIPDIFDMKKNQLLPNIGTIYLSYTQRSRCINDPDYDEIFRNENAVCDNVELRDPQSGDPMSLYDYSVAREAGNFVDQYGDDLSDAILYKVLTFNIVYKDAVTGKYKVNTWNMYLWRRYDDEGDMHFYQTLDRSEGRVRPYAFKSMAVENLGKDRFSAVCTYREGFPKADPMKGDWTFCYKKKTETQFTEVTSVKVDEPNNEARYDLQNLTPATEYDFYFIVKNGDFTTESKKYQVMTAEDDKAYTIGAVVVLAKTDKTISVRCDVVEEGVPSVPNMTCYYRVAGASVWKTLRAPIVIDPQTKSKTATAQLGNLTPSTEYEIKMLVDNGFARVETDVVNITTEQSETPYKLDTPKLVDEKAPQYDRLDVQSKVTEGFPMYTRFGGDYRKSDVSSWTAIEGANYDEGNKLIKANITGLTEGASYHVRFWIANMIDGKEHVSYSNIATFTLLKHWNLDAAINAVAVSSGSFTADAAVLEKGSNTQLIPTGTRAGQYVEVRPYVRYTDDTIATPEVRYVDASVGSRISARVDNLVPNHEYKDVALVIMATKLDGKNVVPDPEVEPFAKTDDVSVTTKTLNYAFGAPEQTPASYEFRVPISNVGVPEATLGTGADNKDFHIALKYGEVESPAGNTDDSIILDAAVTIEEVGASKYLVLTLNQDQAEHKTEGGELIPTFVRVHVNNNGGYPDHEEGGVTIPFYKSEDYAVSPWCKIVNI